MSGLVSGTARSYWIQPLRDRKIRTHWSNRTRAYASKICDVLEWGRYAAPGIISACSPGSRLRYNSMFALHRIQTIIIDRGILWATGRKGTHITGIFQSQVKDMLSLRSVLQMIIKGQTARTVDFEMHRVLLLPYQWNVVIDGPGLPGQSMPCPCDAVPSPVLSGLRSIGNGPSSFRCSHTMPLEETRSLYKGSHWL